MRGRILLCEDGRVVDLEQSASMLLELMEKSYVLATNYQGHLDTALFLQSCDRVLKLLSVYRTFRIVLLWYVISILSHPFPKSPYVWLVVNSRNLEACERPSISP